MQVVAGSWLGEWQLEEQLGAGGCAVVFRARHGETGALAAVKVLTTPGRQAGLGAADLDHPHALAVLEDHRAADPPHVVLELVPGGLTARSLVVRGPAPPARVARLVAEVAAALDHAHQRGQLHLDLKPENVLLRPSGAAVVADFGAAPPREGVRHSLPLSAEAPPAVTTRDYVAPEVRFGAGPPDRRADVYGLAVLTYELLTGRLPLGLEPPSQLVPSLPAAVDRVLARALVQEPGRRTPSCGAFAGELAEAVRPSPAASGAASASPRRALTGALGVAALALVLALGGAPEPRSGIPARALAALAHAPPDARRVVLLAGPGDAALVPPPTPIAARRGGSVTLVPWRGDGGGEELFERSFRNAITRATGARLGLRLGVPEPSGQGPAAAFLIDLPTYTLRAASGPATPALRDLARSLAARIDRPVAVLDAPGPGGRWVSDLLTAALVEAAPAGPVRARLGGADRLRLSGGDVRRGLGVTLAVRLAQPRPGWVEATLVEVETGSGLFRGSALVGR